MNKEEAVKAAQKLKMNVACLYANLEKKSFSCECVVKTAYVCTGCDELVCTATLEYPEVHLKCKHNAVWVSQQ